MTGARPLPEITLPNVGPGPDPCSLHDLARDRAFLVVFLQRDHYCTNCRAQVQDVRDRYAEFRDRDAEVISVVPEPRERVAAWQGRFDLPYPLLADPDGTAGTALDQPVRFGLVGSWSDFFGRMPAVTVVDGRGAEPRIAWSHRGRSTFDRPAIDEILVAVDDQGEGTP